MSEDKIEFISNQSEVPRVTAPVVLCLIYSIER